MTLAVLIGCRAAVLAGFLAALMVPSLVASAATTEQVVVNRYSGLAIDGYDPVAYYTDSGAVRGSANFELRYGGAVWRFCNIGNREAFADRPDIYMPQFGGYDPVGIAGGVAVSGNPNVWLILGERLFLFYNRDRLEKFLADSDRFIAEAGRKWPEVLQTLSP